MTARAGDEQRPRLLLDRDCDGYRGLKLNYSSDSELTRAHLRFAWFVVEYWNALSKSADNLTRQAVLQRDCLCIGVAGKELTILEQALM